jgi:hypothetical protein
MASLASAPDALLTLEQIEVSLRGAVVLAAYCQDAEVLKSAEELPLRGLILSSMPSRLAPAARQLNIPVLLIEGFGKRPMNSAAYKLLTTNDRREVTVNAEMRDDSLGARPEIVISLPGTQSLGLPAEIVMFTAGQQARILRPPHVGQTAVILDVKNRAAFPNGLKAPAATIRLESGETLLLPLANLEVIA